MEGKGCNVGVKCLRIVEITSPRVHDNSLDEDPDAALSSLMSLVVLDPGGPGSFGMDTFNATHVIGDVWVLAHRTGSWVYKGSAAVLEVPIHTSVKSPEVVDTIDTTVQCLEEYGQDGIGETDEIIISGLSNNGEEKSLSGSARAAVLAVEVMVTGWECGGRLPC